MLPNIRVTQRNCVENAPQVCRLANLIEVKLYVRAPQIALGYVKLNPEALEEREKLAHSGSVFVSGWIYS